MHTTLSLLTMLGGCGNVLRSNTPPAPDTLPATTGNPLTVLPAAEGAHRNHFDLADARAAELPSGLASAGGLDDNELVYVVEMAYRPVELSFPGILAPELIYQAGFF